MPKPFKIKKQQLNGFKYQIMIIIIIEEHESNDDTNCNWCTWNGPQKLGKGVGRVENRRTN